MATSITEQADILTYLTITDNELKRLETDRMNKDNWAGIHGEAWSLVKGMLLMRRPPLEEGDLDTPAELNLATCCAVIYSAYQQATMLSDEDKERKTYWSKRLYKALAEVILTSDSTEMPRESFGSMRMLRE